MIACLHLSSGDADLRRAAESLSPKVEIVGERTVVFDAAGLGRLIGAPADVAARLAKLVPGANIALASNREAAIHAARGFAGITIVEPGQEAAALAPLPVELLSPDENTLATFDRWGIRTFADLAALPPNSLAARLGQTGTRLQKLARGEPSTPLVPAVDAPVFEETCELDEPVDNLEPLAFLLNRMLGDLCARLESHALALLELDVDLHLERAPLNSRTLRLPVPVARPAAILKLLQLNLAAHPPSAPVRKVTLRATPAPPRAVQEGLFLPPEPEPAKLEVTIARIASIVGEDNIGAVTLIDTHRPEAFAMTAFRPPAVSAKHPPARAPQLALRVFRPPLAARVALASGAPARIQARGIDERVVACAGPWRTSGDWWTPEPWSRDDWDIAAESGAMYRVTHDFFAKRWSVAGSYD